MIKLVGREEVDKTDEWRWGNEAATLGEEVEV
jgi:hypothetical protein